MASVVRVPFQVHVILVETLYENNIGATSRAMANMAAEKLILINRQCEITFSAQQAAASGQAGLQNRKEYKSWDEFFSNEPDGIRISFSARDGEGRLLKDFASTLNWIKNNHPTFTSADSSLTREVPIYLIFGREDHGLSSQDIELTHFNVRIPTYGDNTSLNLAQAVLLALFILRSEWGVDSKSLSHNTNNARFENKTDQENLNIQPKDKIFPEKTLRRWLEQMGFDLTKPMNAYSVIKRMILHNVPTEKELTMFETALQQSIRKQDPSTIKFAVEDRKKGE
jgi:tRNA/rRNA methyltransferase